MCHCQSPSTHVRPRYFIIRKLYLNFKNFFKKEKKKTLKLFYEALCGPAASLFSTPITRHLTHSTPARQAFLLLLEHTKWSPNAEAMACCVTVWKVLLPGSYMVYFSTSIGSLHKCHLSRETLKPSSTTIYTTLPILPYPASLS